MTYTRLEQVTEVFFNKTNASNFKKFDIQNVSNEVSKFHSNFFANIPASRS